MTIHSVGDKFNLVEYFNARDKTIKAIEQMASSFKPGLLETEAKQIIESILTENHSEKLWHPTKVRFGENTIKSFREQSIPNTRLQENDIFFIDIGPVFNSHEADFGKTFVIGCDSIHLQLKKNSEELFHLTKEIWKKENLTGKALYQFAENEAKKRNLILNLNMDGHRLGDFPHALFFKGGLGEIEECPIENLWILEIHVIDQISKRGAFFEDILMT